METRSKHPISNGLCINVGEITNSDIVNQVLPERLVLSNQLCF
ncbi:hypothetical protein AGR5A_pa50029 [Agrobacterium genomosp. 5 str. CFBP 6626]|nr:hypothetical protein AGR5A_pa50029 [Agrobacterium genomosp. 5 str. CFBP 6626]